MVEVKWGGFVIELANLTCDRTLVYVEGDASLRSWENAEGQRNQALSIVQRMCSAL